MLWFTSKYLGKLDGAAVTSVLLNPRALKLKYALFGKLEHPRVLVTFIVSDSTQF